MADEIWATNVRAPVRLVEAVAPQMTARGKANGDIGGRVVNIASVSAFTGHPDLYYGASRRPWSISEIARAGGGQTHRDQRRRARTHGLQMFDALPQERKDATVASAYAGRAADRKKSRMWSRGSASSRRCTSTARAWTRTVAFIRGNSD